MEFNDWYRAQILSNQEDPPEAIWASLQDELDTDLVWKRLNTSLASKKRMTLWIYGNIAASLALLIAFTALILFFERNNSALQPVVVSDNQTIESSENLEENFILPSHSPDQKAKPELTTITQIPGQNLISDSSPKINLELPALNIASAPPLPVHLLKGKEATLLLWPKTAPIKTSHHTLSSEIISTASDKIGIASFSIGLLGQYANTWLLSPKTITGLQSKELTATNVTFANNIGITSTAMITEKTGIRTDVWLFSQNRQNYFEYINGHYLQTGLELNYLNISILMSQKFGVSRSTHSFNIGGYAGFLQQARQTTGDITRIITNEYSNVDFGLIGGYEYHWPLAKNLFIGTGLFAKIGLTNSYRGTPEIPGFLNRTRNASFIFSFSVNYSIF